MKTTLRTIALAAIAAATLASCEKQNGGEQKPILDYEKKSDTAILLVTFGSTWDDPQLTYKAQIEQFRAAFPGTDVFFSFTSRTCINRWLAEKGEAFVTPDLYLASFIDKGYANVYVQSLHVIPGEEFQLLRDYYVKSCYNFRVQDMTPARHPALCGEALLKSDDDIAAVGTILVDSYAAELRAGEAVAFVGHGNPMADYAHANVPYAKIEKFMQSYGAEKYGNGNIFVGTVDDPTMLLDHVVDGIVAAALPKDKTVHLQPLMSIAGDHANNDMSDQSDPESLVSLVKAAGWPNVKTIKKGLGDYPDINKVWVDHLKKAIANPAE